AISMDDALAVAKGADLLLNLAGQFKNKSILESVRHRAFVDEAPPKPQVYQADYGIDQGLDLHDSFFSVGLNVGRADGEIPTCGRTWHPIVHPVVLDRWPAQIDGSCDRFT